MNFNKDELVQMVYALGEGDITVKNFMKTDNRRRKRLGG
jgi:hypothetical protein